MTPKGDRKKITNKVHKKRDEKKVEPELNNADDCNVLLVVGKEEIKA